MMTPPFLSSCVFAFGERRILREEGYGDGDTADGRLFKGGSTAEAPCI